MDFLQNLFSNASGWVMTALLVFTILAIFLLDGIIGLIFKIIGIVAIVIGILGLIQGGVTAEYINNILAGFLFFVLGNKIAA